MTDELQVWRIAVRPRFRPNRGSHLPVLMKAVQLTTGPILELGAGIYSTNPLHWACYAKKRRLVSYENHPDYYDFLNAYACDFHEVHCIEHWEEIDISEPWSVAFVDNKPGNMEAPGRRYRDCIRLQHAEYVVMHDTERRNETTHRMSEVAKVFKYRYWWRGAYPNTTVYSNVHDLTNFLDQ